MPPHFPWWPALFGQEGGPCGLEVTTLSALYISVDELYLLAESIPLSVLSASVDRLLMRSKGATLLDCHTKCEWEQSLKHKRCEMGSGWLWGVCQWEGALYLGKQKRLSLLGRQKTGLG